MMMQPVYGAAKVLHSALRCWNMQLQSLARPSETMAQDRRRSARKMRQLEGWLCDSCDGVMRQQHQVIITSLSLHGVGFNAPKVLEPGAAHWIVVSNDRLHLSTRVRIMSVRPREMGSCDVGAEFF